jgi:hypothetical protein
MDNKLIYFTLGNNTHYLNLAYLCLESLARQGYNGQLLFITNLDHDLIRSYVGTKFDLLFMDSPSETLVSSSANKLKIYQYPKIHKYSTIIFCDIDVIWVGSPDNIFSLISDDLLYMSNELDGCLNPKHFMSSPYFGGDIFSDQEKRIIDQNQIYGLNAGFFAFNNHMLHHIEQMDTILTSNPHLMNSCLEQPLVNTYAYRNNIYSNSLNSFVCHDGYNVKKYTGTALHFAGGPGNYSQKINCMEKYFHENFSR